MFRDCFSDEEEKKAQNVMHVSVSQSTLRAGLCVNICLLFVKYNHHPHFMQISFHLIHHDNLALFKRKKMVILHSNLTFKVDAFESSLLGLMS